MIKLKKYVKFGLTTLLGLAAVGLLATSVPVYDNTGTGTPGFNNNNYTSTSGMTMKTGVANQGGTVLSSGNANVNAESNINIGFSNATFTTEYTDNAGLDSQGVIPSRDDPNVNNLETGTGTASHLMVNDKGLMNNNGQLYQNGFIKVTGSIDIKATINKNISKEEIQSGNYGAMVKVTLPEDVDASQLQDAIQWDKAYFMLKLDDIKVAGVKYGSPSFPMQFDHHVYLDPNQANAFYLKVKGIPINVVDVNSGISGGAYMQLARPGKDNTDLANNITSNSSNGGYLNPTALFGTSSTSGTTNNSLFNSTWSFDLTNVGGGALQKNGDIGWSFAIANAAPNFAWLMGSGFTGKANINFYVNLNKYTGNIKDISPNKQLTAGKLPPSSRADGLFNLKIDVFGTNQLIDPFSASASKSAAGRTPIDYALVSPSATPTPATVTSNITSWSAYASPWDTKKSLNAATSAWESVGGSKTRLNNVALNDTLTDRVVTLDVLTDGVMTGKAIDYSGTKAPVLGAVGSNRFARAVNYFTAGVANADKTTATATLTAKTYTAMTAGKADTSKDAVLAGLPSLTPNTTNKNYLYYTGTTTSSAGTQIPLLPAPLFFNQTNLPAAPTIAWNSDNVYYIKKSELTSGKTVALKGTWGDDYANADTISANDNKSGTTLANFAKVEANSSKAFSLNVASGTTATNNPLNLGTTDATLLGLHTITATINRPTLKLANGETITSNANAKATLNVYVVDDTTSYNVTATKSILISGNKFSQQTVHGPTAGNNQTGDTVTFETDVTNKGTASIAKPVLSMPLPSQLKNLSGVTATINGTTVTATATVTNGMLQIALAKPIPSGGSAVITYKVQATATMPTGGLTSADMIMDGTTYVGATGKVTLLPAPSGGIEITPPTNLEFGKHQAVPGLYNNTDGDKTLLVTDNRATPGPWTVSAQLSNFSNADGSRKLTGETAQITFGTPALSSAVYVAGGTAKALISNSNSQTSNAYIFKNIQLQLAGTKIQPGDYHATITYSWTDGVK
ncbi:WxL domain-containing protein [Loigolactobacillus zhaoyuanensis]|uniref:hypothetical protein n=1 Tax=Loigolactobacillus zhaoyuanensis TaxID=2486017 RepID=UPI000F737D38|nr:hypothetical protein [Loigolactobacillus zhaoyuanensis]